MHKLHLTTTGYVLGIAMVLSSIIYFFAANWSGMDRYEKIVLSVGLLILFYGSAYLSNMLRLFGEERTFLAHLLLWAGCFSFGICLALLGQIYNSHADSYTLYGIWLLPTVAFAIITRFTSFYILSYGLLHLTIWFYFYPVSVLYYYDDLKQTWITLLLATVNFLILLVLERGILQSKLLRIVSYLALHIALIALSNSHFIGDVAYGFNILSIASLAFAFWWYAKKTTDKLMLSLTALATSGYAIVKFIELADHFASESFFMLGLLFVGVLLTANYVFFRHIQKLKYRQQSENDHMTTSHVKQTDPRVDQPTHSSDIATHIVSTAITVIGVFIGTVSVIALVMLTLDNYATDINVQDVLFVLSLVLLVPMFIFQKIQSTVRYTLLSIGFLVGFIGAFRLYDDGFIPLIFTGIAGFGTFYLSPFALRILTYLLCNLALGISLTSYMEHFEFIYMLIFITLANGTVYWITRLKLQTPNYATLRPIALSTTLLGGFWITFLDPIFKGSYFIFNIAFAIVSIVFLIVSIRKHRHVEAWISFIFSLAYLIYKYYDLLWSLLHKSITLAISGGIFLLATYLWSRLKERTTNHIEAAAILGRKKRFLIVFLVLLQLCSLGVISARNEYLLKNGTPVKLSLEPIDPRAMLQGDYVQLRYEITSPDALRNNQINEEGKIQIVLGEGEDHVYHFERIYEGEKLMDNEVIINGRLNGIGMVYYGIESYFIPEGSGREVEQEAKFAYVRISKNGNAILERISDE